jgi:glycosyltransferase involved in cell wall biosynthesis
MKEKGFEISLVICTYNRCRYLPEALKSIQSQTLSFERFELIIIDNNSTDDTAAIAQQFIINNPQLTIRYCFEAQKGLSFARNRGIKEANAPIINYVDDDAILSPGYLEAMLQFFLVYPHAVGAGGKVIPKYEDGREPEWMSKYLYGFIGKIDFGNEIQLFTKEMKYPVGCNMAYRKTILEKAGGFNQMLQFRSDDKYIFYQVKKIATQIYFVPSAWLYHYIDAHRLEIHQFKKLFLKTGNEEKKRVSTEQGTAGIIKKGIEFIFKTGASVILFIIFSLKGQYSKGKYIFISQYCTLKGFLKKDIFVR